ncbi:hypothetical protein LIA77_00379 [Sarocladium implicatum]|nr:hypothetical protein LIA77_00379 [Sarocladium implicatum]
MGIGLSETEKISNNQKGDCSASISLKHTPPPWSPPRRPLRTHLAVTTLGGRQSPSSTAPSSLGANARLSTDEASSRYPFTFTAIVSSKETIRSNWPLAAYRSALQSFISSPPTCLISSSFTFSQLSFQAIPLDSTSRTHHDVSPNT